MADKLDETKAALHFKTTIKTYDFSAMVAYLEKDIVLGGDFSGYIKDGGFYGEFTYTFTDEDDSRDNFFRGVLGYSYAWPSGLILGVEAYYNGGALDKNPDNISALMDMESALDTLNKYFIGLNASYQLHPLVTLSGAFIYEPDKGSFVLAPAMEWLYSDHMAIVLGMQVFGGAQNGEYGAYNNISYIRIRWDI